jgi:CMP-N,N'-diacetyllegionaminic acid synthase
MKYIAEIPVRLGSKRVTMKNLRLINGKPMVAYAIEAAKRSRFIDKVYVNSEAEIMRKLCADYGVDFYKRRPELAEDNIIQDEFNYDFLCNVEMENLVLINPVSPLVLPEDIDNAIMYYEEHHLDSLISVREEKLQSFFKGKPLNLNIDGPLPMTQNLIPIQLCAWTVCIWNAKKFREHYEKYNYAVFVGNFGLYPFDPVRSIKVSSEEDFILAELYLKSKLSGKSEKVKYYE